MHCCEHEYNYLPCGFNDYSYNTYMSYHLHPDKPWWC